jgi:ABC-type methionine transport system ATPase subunit
MAKRQVTLTYPQNLIKEPVLYQMAMKYNVIPNIRRARVTETIGEMVIELEGTEENLQAGLKHLSDQGVTVQSAEGDVIEP